MTQTILIVDDDEAIRRMVMTTLERAGYGVVGVADGLAGIKMVEQQRPDLAVVDLLIPSVMGFDVCRKIRTFPNCATLPIVVTSAVALGDDARRKIREHFGIRHVLQKPFPFKDLLGAIKEALGKEALGNEAIGNEAISNVRRETLSASRTDERDATAWTPEDGNVGLARFRPAPSDDGSLAAAGENSATLPELLVRLFRAEATGVLALSDGVRTKEIAFDHGTPVRILVAFPGENIGQAMLDVGHIDASALGRAVKHADRQNVSLEQAFLATKIVSKDELQVYQRMHAHQVILSAFTAYGCTWSFRRTELNLPDVARLAIDPFVLVWEGVSETLSLQELTNHFLPRRGECPRLTESYTLFAARLAGVLPVMTPVETIDGKTPLSKLLARSSLGIASTLRVLYTLELCGALRFAADVARAPAPTSRSTETTSDIDHIVDTVFGRSFSLPSGQDATRPAESSPGFVIDAERAYAAARDQAETGSWSEAISSSQRAVTASPNDPRLHISLAETYLMSEGIETHGPIDPSRSVKDTRAILDAEAALVTALRLKPRAPHPLCLLARVCLLRGRREQAMTLFEFARQIDPENDEVRAGLTAVSGRASSAAPSR